MFIEKKILLFLTKKCNYMEWAIDGQSRGYVSTKMQIRKLQCCLNGVKKVKEFLVILRRIYFKTKLILLTLNYPV